MFTEDDVKDLVKKAIDVALVKFKNQFYYDGEVLLEQALKVQPDNLEALQLLGLMQHGMQNFEKATETFSKCLSIDPDNPENLNNLALCKSNLGKYDEAIDLIKKALDLKSDTGYLYSNLGLQYRHIENLEEAIFYFQKALELTPTAMTWCVLGGCYGEMKDLDKAKECFEKALEIEPEFDGGHVDLASVYMMTNEYEKAWSHYEYRYSVYPQLKIFKIIFEPEKKWDGSDPKGKRILVHGEQGNGDYIHFIRYVKSLRDLGAYVILHCDKSFERLYAPLADELFMIDPNQIPPYNKRGDFSMPFYDYHCSVMSLPHLLQMKNIPVSPYLEVNEKLDLSEYDKFFKIGIAWSGNPQHPNDKYRSCELVKFLGIHNIPNVKLFSLVTDIRPRMYKFQKEPIDLAAGSSEMKIIDMSSIIKDFYDTATILNSLDLIITVDTSVLHLAGALGRPTWGLIPWSPDWRWGLTGESSVWYSSVKLFRQKEKNNWNELFQRLENEVLKWTKN